jgi:hypothetical protein
MKSYSIVLWLFVGGLAVLVISCDPCKDVTCKHGEPEKQSSSECICNCDKGYEGEKCGKAVNKRFIADYQATDTCGGYLYGPRDCEVYGGDAPDEVYITQFASYNIEVRAVIEGDTIILPEQRVDSDQKDNDFHFGRTVGKKVNDNDFELPYEYTSKSFDDDTCTAFFRRQ